ncbi:MAG: hypothetical protein PUH70_02015 [Clostridiales bacterium]|nr:hypothetical protein [Clostridiales bacterium]MDY5514200.1 hypothetical protein [Candidatus Ventricola sp.]
MMDNFKEDIVSSRSTLLPNILYVISWIFVVIFGLYALLMLQVLFVAFSASGLIITVLSAAAAVLLFLLKDNLKVEYEYTFTNGSLDFAKVMRGARRKELGSMNVANVAACGHVAHDSFRRYLSMKDVEKKNWFLNRDGNLFYFYYVKENKKHMIIIEPSEEMVGMIVRYVQPGVYQG